MSDEMRTLGTRIALKVWNCAHFVPWHGTWPDSWQLAFCSRTLVLYGLLFAVGYKFHTLSHFLNCDGLLQDWHSHCTSTWRESAYDTSGTSEGVQGRLNRPVNNSTQEVTQWKQLDC